MTNSHRVKTNIYLKKKINIIIEYNIKRITLDMFTNNEIPVEQPAKPDNTLLNVKYKSIIQNTTSNNELNYNVIDQLLEKEKQKNKSDTWNKLDKTVKIQKLHAFAERYGKEHSYPMKEIKHLKMFFIDCLEKMKLQKTKDVIYDKDTGDVTSIPALHFNSQTHNFTLKITDSKRVNTLKSLTPKRTSEKNLGEKNLQEKNLQENNLGDTRGL